MLTEPLSGWRHVVLSERRTRLDFAHCIKESVDIHYYPEAEVIVLVMDNLNTHTPASLYDEAFAPEEAKRLADRLEIHYTPKHGSWLNMAEIELSVLAKQCLGDRRLPDQETLSGGKSRRGSKRATVKAARSTGASRRRMPASSSSTSTPHSTNDEALA